MCIDHLKLIVECLTSTSNTISSGNQIHISR